MRGKTGSAVVAAIVALWPATVSASDMTGLATLMALGFVVAPLTLIHLMVMVILAIRGSYREQKAALRHAGIASVAPIFGMLVTMWELGASRHAQDRMIVLLLLLGVLALSWLPVAIHRFQRPAGAREYRRNGGSWTEEPGSRGSSSEPGSVSSSE